MERTSGRIDLAGQRFGMLTALRPAESANGRTAWVCRCDCGNETTVKTYHLRSGHTRSCGCLRPRAADNPLGLTFVDGTCVEILAAGTVPKNNRSGVRGVHWMASKRVWRAEIGFKGQRHYLGIYTRFEDAVKARKRAEEELFGPILREYAGAESRGAAR